jgi:phospholipase D1/2
MTMPSRAPAAPAQRNSQTTDEPNAPVILRPGRNCWRIERSKRVSFLIDGEAYFAAFREAAKRARRSIVIVGWDLDSRTTLVRDGSDDGLPPQLGDFLNALLQREPELQVYILNWDFVMLYASDREVLPAFKLGWRNRGRLHFRLDDQHPMGASHHQKIVVIDDAVAFVGGMDLAERRWDTTTHSPKEGRRCSHNGTAYAPFHDVQVMVDGDTATALSDLARERWRRATGHALRAGARPVGLEDPWPPTIVPDVTDVEIGIARTEPNYNKQLAVLEVRQLFLDEIAAARRFIYIENQYLTAHAAGEALAAKLHEPDGPEIVIVSRLGGGAWLERSTMTVLRWRLLKRLRAADTHGRLRVYYPDNAGLGDLRIDLHTKLMIVDDRTAHVGSANLNNRSMGIDTECDLFIEAHNAATQAAIAGLRNRLLAEHLGTEPEAVTQAMQEHNGSLIDAVESLQGNPRTLKPLVDDVTPETDALVPEAAIIDPEQPLDPDELVNEFVPDDSKPSARKRITTLVSAILVITALVAIWRWSPLNEWVNVETVTRAAQAVENAPFTPLWVMCIYVVASLIAMPITVLIAATVIVFGPLAGLAYALTGSLLGALASFGVGKMIGRRRVRRIAGERINKLSRRLGKRGLLAVFVVRVLPIAPFTVVNLVAGVSHIRLRDYLLGTVLGMLPGMLAITVFSDRLVATLRDPSPASLAVLALAIAVIVAGALGLQAILRRHGISRSNGSRSTA